MSSSENADTATATGASSTEAPSSAQPETKSENKTEEPSSNTDENKSDVAVPISSEPPSAGVNETSPASAADLQVSAAPPPAVVDSPANVDGGAGSAPPQSASPSSKPLPNGAKYDRVCPSVLKGETCWALSKGRACHYTKHTVDSAGPPGGANNNSNVYVCHLPLVTTKEQVQEMFQPYGDISECKMLVDPKTKFFKGVAFVHFTSNGDAKAAIESINGLKLEGHDHPLECRFAKPNAKSGTAPRKGAPYGPGGRRAGGAGRDSGYRTYDTAPSREARPVSRYDDRGGYGPDRRRRSRPPSPGHYRRDEYDYGPSRDYGPPPSRYYDDYDRGPPRRSYDPYLEEDIGRGPPPGRYDDPYYDRGPPPGRYRDGPPPGPALPTTYLPPILPP